jgi:gamma-glutamylputrescine oxidase
MRTPAESGRPARLSRRALLQRAGIATAGIATGGAALNALLPTVLPPAQAIDRNLSYWSLALPDPNPPLAAALDADVVVIGGGFTGLSTACYLRQQRPGQRVVLLEAERCGNGASARNGAMLLTSTADRYLVVGDDPALDRRIHEMTVANIATLQALSQRIGVDAEIDLGGALHVLLAEGDTKDAIERALRLRDAGIPVEYWNRERTAAAIGTGAYTGSLFNPAAGQVHPGRLVALWKRAAEAAGADIYEHTAVTHIEEGSTHVLTTSTGVRIRTPSLVLATNAYGEQLGYLARAAAGVWDYVAITAPLGAAAIDALGWHSRSPYDDAHTETYYLGITRDNRVHIGGGPVDYLFNGAIPGAELQQRRQQALAAALTRLYPSLSGVALEHRWAGLVDMSLDASPAVGSMGKFGNIHYAIGFSGHGVNLTSVFGRVLADLICGHGADWAWLPYLNQLPPYVPNEPLRWLGVRARLAAIRASES